MSAAARNSCHHLPPSVHIYSVLTHHLAEDDEEPDGGRLHGVEAGSESGCGEEAKSRCGGDTARLGTARLESGRVGSVGAQRSASGSSPPAPNSAARLGTDRNGSDRRSSAGARSWMSFGGRALALLPLWLGGGGGGRAKGCAPPTALNGNQCLPSNILMAHVRACVRAPTSGRERERFKGFYRYLSAASLGFVLHYLYGTSHMYGERTVCHRRVL